MKLFILTLLIPCQIFCCQSCYYDDVIKIDSFEYVVLICDEICKIEDAILLLNDPSDAYTYYYLIGIREGLLDSMEILDRCVVP